jgi:alanyl-tRNA synthetase
MEQEIKLNEHNKQEYPPMHSAEHILNRTMVNMFGCNRSHNAHIERKKSKCDYYLSECPTAEQMQAVEDKVNEVIKQHLDVTERFVKREEVDSKEVDLNKLPQGVSDTLRLVYVGDYDVCACVGTHVENTSEIGTFKLISHDYNEGVLRIRFKLVEKK